MDSADLLIVRRCPSPSTETTPAATLPRTISMYLRLLSFSSLVSFSSKLVSLRAAWLAWRSTVILLKELTRVPISSSESWST